MQLAQHPSPNHNTGRQGSIPDMIVCHITEGAFAGAVTWLTDPASQVSSHFVIAQDGQAAQLVDIADTAWANGTSTNPASNLWHGHSTLAAVRNRGINANRYTISIEYEGRHAETQGALTPAQLETSVTLIRHIQKETARLYGQPLNLTRATLVGHNEITPRTRPLCPGARFPFEEILARLAAPETPDPPGTPDGDSPSRWAQEAWQWATEQGLIDGTNPRGSATREQMVTMLFRYHRILAATVIPPIPGSR